MDPTQIKPGERTAPLPVPAGVTAPEPYQRAPTLMAGVTAGSQGQVKVWGPRKRTLWMLVGALPAVVAIVLGLGALLHDPFAVLYSVVTPSIAFVLAIRALYRPCYVTTDDAGIGVATWTGSRALRWNEIQSVKTHSAVTPRRVTRMDLSIAAQTTLKAQYPVASGRVTICTDAGGDVEMNLTGYPASMHRELLSLIIDRAGLCQHPVAMQHYVREDAVPLRVRSFFISGILAGRSPEGRLIVKEVAAYSSASDVGITPGDEILALHGRSVDGLSAEQVYRALSRREGEMIELRVRHTVQEDVHDYRIRTQQPSGQPALNAGGDLGISVSKDEEGRLLVEALGPGCPAMDAGIRPGDELVSVNGLPADAISAEQAEAEMSGPSGAMVFLTVRREDDVRIEEYRLPTRSMTRE